MKNKTPSKLTSRTRIAIGALGIVVLLLVGCIICWFYIEKYTVKVGAYCEAGECVVPEAHAVVTPTTFYRVDRNGDEVMSSPVLNHSEITFKTLKHGKN